MQVFCPKDVPQGGLGEQPGADAEHVHAGLDGGRLAPLGVDRDLPPPGLRVIDDVVVKQGAGVDHLTDARHPPLEVTDPGRGHAKA